jgi:tetratricopeptide (TPR) repeat protein
MTQRKAARPRSESARKKLRARPTGEEAERYNKAVETFERAVKNLHKSEPDRAQSLFESILTGYPDERELGERARVYLEVCKRLSRSSNPSPRDFEEVVTYGVVQHNQGLYDKAAKYLSRAVEMQPKSDYAHYCLAACYAQLGDSRAAAKHLKEAIQASGYNRVLARTDPDFDSVRQADELADLLS